MERTQHGLFASHISSLSATYSFEVPTGAYDPGEQMWKDNGTVQASCAGPGQFCTQNSDCCSILGILSACLGGQCIL